MIPAHKGRLFEAWFRGVARRRLAGTFGGLHLIGVESLEAAARLGPILVVSNHTAFWDALVLLHVVGTELGLDGYALMDAANLADRPYFSRVGAFGVDRSDPRDALATVRYGAGLLDRPGRLVWVFPQGEERPITERPLVFAGGAAAMGRLARAPVQVVPAALRYEFGAEARPEIFLQLGPPAPPLPDLAAETARQAEAVSAGLDALDARIRQGEPAPRERVCLVRSPSRLGALAERALARGLPAPTARSVPRLASRRG